MAAQDLVFRSPGAGASLLFADDTPATTGTVATEVPAPKPAATGQIVYASVAAVALVVPAASATGAQNGAVNGIATATLATPEAAAAGALALSGATSTELAAIEAVVAAAQTFAAQATSALSGPMSSSAANTAAVGVAGPLLPGLTAASSAAVAAPVSGAVDTALSALTLDAPAVARFVGAASAALPTMHADTDALWGALGDVAVSLPTLHGGAAGPHQLFAGTASTRVALTTQSSGALSYLGAADVALHVRADATGATLTAGDVAASIALRTASAGVAAFVGVAVVGLPALRADADATTNAPPPNLPGTVTLPTSVVALFTIDLPATAEPLDTIELPSDMSRKLHIGDIARANRIRFKREGVLRDPTTLRFEVFPENSDPFTLEYGVASDEEGGDAVIRESQGVYSLHFLLTAERGAGRYRYNAIATGDVTAAEPSLEFDVHPLHAEEEG